MFFIHGGGYTLGSSDIKVYGPDLLVSKDVVVVTLNYRLNILGEYIGIGRFPNDHVFFKDS